MKYFLVVLALVASVGAGHADNYGTHVGALMYDMTVVYTASKKCGLVITQDSIKLIDELNLAPNDLKNIIRPKVQAEVIHGIKVLGLGVWCDTVWALYGPNGTEYAGLLQGPQPIYQEPDIADIPPPPMYIAPLPAPNFSMPMGPPCEFDASTYTRTCPGW